MKNKKYLLFIMVVWIILLIPFAGMLVHPTNETTENKELSEMPALKTEGKWNEKYLSQLGTYFEDHFAFRQSMVTGNAFLRSKVLKSPSTKQVIVGDEGWLYFGGTLNDYQGKNMLSERELFNTVHNLSLIQNYVEQQGSRFWLMIAPNKNSLYGENMPYYYLPGQNHNVKTFTKMLKQQGVQYVDLYQAFESSEEILYFARDSHWNNKGAIMASNTLFDAMGKEHETYLNVPFTTKKDHVGDIEEMQYPLAIELEEDYYYESQPQFRYKTEVKDTMDAWIETENPNKEGSLLMFRDSFGESLLPFVADEVAVGYFSRLVPYNLTQIEQLQPDDVIIEKVERNIQDFAKQVPIMEGPLTETIPSPEAKTQSTVSVSAEGSYLMVKGIIDPKYMTKDAAITVSVRDKKTMETKTYEAFYTMTKKGDGNGYQVYVKGASVPDGDIQINVQVTRQGQGVIVAAKEVQWDKMRRKE